MKDHFIHPSYRSSVHPSNPSVLSWSVYSNGVEKTVEYRHCGCLHIINNFYLPHVGGAGYAKQLKGFCFVSWSFFCQRSQGDLTLFSRLKSLRTPLLMGKFYAHSSYSIKFWAHIFKQPSFVITILTKRPYNKRFFI